MAKQILAIIPARGGSKGIFRKNLQLLGGKPLLVHTIEAARSTPSINRIVVSTDDPEIGAAAVQHGAEVIWRSAEISGDKASSESALLHVLAYLQEAQNYQPDILVFLQCTAPLTAPEDIEGTIRALIDQEANTALAVTPFHYFLWKPDAQGGATGVNHDKSERLLRQEREPQYLETGAVYVMRVDGFIEKKHRFFGKTAMHVIPAERTLEIDELVDFKIAEMLLRDQQRCKITQALPDPVGALIFDFDGVFTDNQVIVGQDGTEAVFANRGDGWGLAQLTKQGLPMLVISSEANPVVQARCNKLNIPFKQGVNDKWDLLKGWLADRSIPPESAVFVGNDLNDLACLQNVGCGVVVADAHPGVRFAAKIILEKKGGQGAVREISDLVLEHLKSKSSD